MTLKEIQLILPLPPGEGWGEGQKQYEKEKAYNICKGFKKEFDNSRTKTMAHVKKQEFYGT